MSKLNCKDCGATVFNLNRIGDETVAIDCASCGHQLKLIDATGFGSNGYPISNPKMVDKLIENWDVVENMITGEKHE